MTVSRTLNDPDLVTPATRARVLSAVREMGYIPNGVARSLTQGRTHLIALVVSDIENPFFTSMVRGAEDVARLKERVVELQRQAAVSEIELERLRGKVERLEAQLAGRAPAGSAATTPPPSRPVPVQPPRVETPPVERIEPAWLRVLAQR